MSFDYYVYEVKYCGFSAYIGSGCGTRYQHVRSGKSHNKILNEIRLRYDLLGEPNMTVNIIKECKTKQNSLNAEKALIKKLKPMFNSQWSCSGEAKILTQDEYAKFDDEHKWLLEALRAVEGIGEDTGVNANLIFTPFGFRVPVTDIKWDTKNFDLVAISLTGDCDSLHGICESVIDHKENIVMKIKPEFIVVINKQLGYERFVDNFNSTNSNGKALMYRDDYNPNKNGTIVPDRCSLLFDNTTILARTINIRRKIKIVCSLNKLGTGVYSVHCMNNGQELFTTKSLSSALEYHRGLDMSGDLFFTYVGNTRHEVEFFIDGCKNFETGKTYSLSNKGEINVK